MLDFYGGLLARELICMTQPRTLKHLEILEELELRRRGTRCRATFYGMSVHVCSPLRLRLQRLQLLLLPLQLLYPEVVFMDGHAQHYLGAVLVNDELVQLLSQGLGRDVPGAYIARAAQGPSERLFRLVEGGEALPAEVGAIVRGRSARGRQGSAARDAVECQVGCAGPWRDGADEGPLQHRGETEHARLFT
jgi:hypothetical protein